MYAIAFEENVEEELAVIRPFEARRLLQAIREQLRYRPSVQTRQRKKLRGVKPPFRSIPPLWELRVGEYRVFYDVNEEERTVYVRAVRHKPPHKTTEEIL